eukprot:5861316-Prymnesium_polylepis.1
MWNGVKCSRTSSCTLGALGALGAPRLRFAAARIAARQGARRELRRRHTVSRVACSASERRCRCRRQTAVSSTTCYH